MRRNADNVPALADQKNRTDSAGFVTFCVQQIEAAVDEVAENLDKLSRAIMTADRQADGILSSVVAGGDGPVAVPTCEELESLRSAARKASLQLQSLDRFHQRLGNACNNLTRIAELMRSGDLPTTNDSWQDFLTEARDAFTMDTERKMFDAVFECDGSKTNEEWAQNTSTGPLLF